MLKLTATVTGVNPQAIAHLREKRRTDGAVAMTEDEHQTLLDLGMEQADLAHAKWAAGRVVAYLRDVVEDGGHGNGNTFRRTAIVRGKPRLDAAVELAADSQWVNIQLNTLRVKVTSMDAAKAHLNALMVKLIEREVGNGK